VIPRVGYIWIGVRGTDGSVGGLRQGLADRGYIVGRNLLLEERYAEGKAERVPELIAEILALSVDVLVTPGTPITLAAQRATSTIPIVCVTGNPVGVGLVASSSRGKYHWSVVAFWRLQREVAGATERGGAEVTSRRSAVEPR
jgi:putative ABC transport system substrate-binding protein